MTEKENKILREAQERLRKCEEDDSENRRMALSDLEFTAVEGAQWPQHIRAERDAENRPCLTINKMPVFVDQVVGDQRMNRPSVKVIPVDSRGDKEVARILGGWIKHVQQISRADVAIDHAFEHAVTCGYGAFRVVTKYVSDQVFEQDVFIEKIDNALAVYWGPHTEYDCSDAMYCFVVSEIDREEFRQKYDVEPIPYSGGDSRYSESWSAKDKIRIVEYYVKEATKKTIYLLADGRVVDKLMDGDIEERRRIVNSYKIKWYLLHGGGILEEKVWAGRKYIPVIPVWGKELNVGGKRVIRGLIRNAKDPQRMYNYWQSCDTELVALQPKSPYMITPKQIEGHEQMWNNAHKHNKPYLLVNADKEMPHWPKRETPPQVSTAMVEKLKESDQEMRDTVGLQKASLGMQSNERSGVAIRERKKEGDIGTFAFVDNLARSVEHMGRILVDVAPSVLDTQRVIRLGLDNGEYEFREVNVEAPDGSVLHDLSIGSYDVVVTVGPSFTTQRTEANESMREFIQYYPEAAPVIGDLYAKSMDWPGSDELSQRLEFLIPPEIRQAIAAKKAAQEGRTVQPPTGTSSEPSPEQQAVAQDMEFKQKEFEMKMKEWEFKLKQEEARLEGLRLQNDLSSKEKVRQYLEELKKEEEDEDENSSKPSKSAEK